VLYLSETQVREMLGPPEMMDQVIRVVEEGFRSWSAGTAANEPRRRVRAPSRPSSPLDSGGGAMLHLMGAADSKSGYLGCKAYTTSREGANFFVLLFGAANGKPLAIIEADYLGQMRTGAASGVATKYMARRDASRLGVIGTGQQALTQVQAIDCIREICEVRVFSRDRARREDFANRLRAKVNVTVRVCDTARETVQEAGIVVTATGSSQPVFLGEWMEPGMHINAIGGNAASRRELDEAAVRRADRIVTDSVEQARIEAGELIATPRGDEVIELSQVVSGKAPGRGSAQEVTLFKSIGVALEDIALAGWLYEQETKGRA
jgi:ornithine cyclodeaminase/alanine dehydrogenase-like protein (mu-crystallin family)